MKLSKESPIENIRYDLFNCYFFYIELIELVALYLNQIFNINSYKINNLSIYFGC